MKKIIILFSFALMIFLQNTKLFSQEKIGTFYFLTGTEGNEKAIMYLNILDSGSIYGSYYTRNKYFSFSGIMDGSSIDIIAADEKSSIKAKFDKNNITLEGKHGSKKVSLSLANTSMNTLSILGLQYESDDGYVHIESQLIPIHKIDPKTAFEYEISLMNEEKIEDIIEEYRSEGVDYLDNNVISIGISETLYNGIGYKHYKFNEVYDKRSLKIISIEDFLDTKNIEFLALLRNKVDNFFSEIADMEVEDDSHYYDIHNPYNPYFYSIGNNGCIYLMLVEFIHPDYDDLVLEFKFEELKPFVKKGSPLEYLFN